MKFIGKILKFFMTRFFMRKVDKTINSFSRKKNNIFSKIKNTFKK